MVTKEQLLIIILFPLWWVLVGMCLTLIYDIEASSLVKLLLLGLRH